MLASFILRAYLLAALSMSPTGASINKDVICASGKPFNYTNVYQQQRAVLAKFRLCNGTSSRSSSSASKPMRVQRKKSVYKYSSSSISIHPTGTGF